MAAKFAKKFRACVGKAVYPTVFESGDECPAELVDVATEARVLEGQDDEGADGAAAAKGKAK